MSACHDPNCKIDVIYTAFQNERTGTWVILPLEQAEDEGDFTVLQATHETVDIMKRPVGTYLISIHRPGFYRTHRPSHFLEPGSHPTFNDPWEAS